MGWTVKNVKLNLALPDKDDRIIGEYKTSEYQITEQKPNRIDARHVRWKGTSMSNVMKELKAEIGRVSRREINKELVPIKRVNAAQRGWIADLRRQLTELQKQVSQLTKAVPAADLPVATLSGDAEAPARFWISGKGVRNLRQRLGLTQAQFGKLAGVSGQTIVNWEGTKGKISLRRKDTPGRLQEIRKMKKRDVKALLPKKAKSAKKAT